MRVFTPTAIRIPLRHDPYFPQNRLLLVFFFRKPPGRFSFIAFSDTGRSKKKPLPVSPEGALLFFLVRNPYGINRNPFLCRTLTTTDNTVKENADLASEVFIGIYCSFVCSPLRGTSLMFNIITISFHSVKSKTDFCKKNSTGAVQKLPQPEVSAYFRASLMGTRTSYFEDH